MTALPKVPAQGQGPQFIDINTKVGVIPTKHAVQKHGKTHAYEAIEAVVSLPLSSLYPKDKLKGDARLSFVEYTDSKGVFHRQVTQKHLKASSKAFEPLFDMLTHAIVIHQDTAKNKADKNKADKKSAAPQVPDAIMLKDKDIKVEVSKKGKTHAITVVASATINPDFQVIAVQDKKGVSDIRLTQKTLSAIEKAKKEGKKDSDAIIHALQKVALTKIAQFKKEHAGKKIDKPAVKKNDEKKKDAPQKAEANKKPEPKKQEQPNKK